MAVLSRSGTRYEKVGFGNHSDVFRRPGSRWCVQVFRPDCPDLTVDKVLREYAYLREAYTEMPQLIPYQWLFVPRQGAHISQTLMVKRWVQVDASLLFSRIRRPDLTLMRRAQVDQFLSITRSLLDRAAVEETFLPDILDPRWTNLAFDTSGVLRLLDTNRLINTKVPRRLGPRQTLDLGRRPVHAKWLRRLMFLETRLGGRCRDDLCRDPLYCRYLTDADFSVLFEAGREAGEPI